MANEQNLKPFQKGNKAAVGHGRPKGSMSLKKRLENYMEAKIEYKGESKETNDLFIMAMVTKALKGSERMMELILKLRGELPTTTRMELTGKDGEPIKQSIELSPASARIADIIKRGEKAGNKAPLPD